MFYKSNCSSIYELQDSKIRITITCIHSKIYDHTYRYVSRVHICALEVKGLNVCFMYMYLLAIEYVTVHEYVNKMSPYSTVITP